MAKIKINTINITIITFMIIILFASSIIFLPACAKDDKSLEKTSEEESSYMEAAVEARNMSSKINLFGMVLAETTNIFYSEVSGELLFIAHQGDMVKESEVLAEVDNSDALDGLAEIEMSIENAESFLRIAQINYQSALNTNHIAIQLAETNTKKAQVSTASAFASLEDANRSANLAYEIAERVLKQSGTQGEIEAAKEQLESAKISNKSSTVLADMDYDQSLLDQSSTYWDNLSNMQLAKAQIAITAESIKQAELQVKAAKIEFEAAGDSLQEYTLVAPYDCLVTSVSGSEGNKINADQQVIEIIAHNSIIIRADLPEVDKNKIEEDMEVNIYFNAYPENLVKGNVFRIGRIPVITNAGTFYEIFIEFTDLQGVEMEDIYSLNVEIEIITSGKDNILVVPIDYVHIEGSEKYVYKITAEGDIEKTYVETGISDLSYIEIVSGLEEGGRVIINRQ